MDGQHEHLIYATKAELRELRQEIASLKPLPPPPATVKSVLNMSDTEWIPVSPVHLKPSAVPWDAIAEPNNWWHGPRAYAPQTGEVVVVDRPIYTELLKYVKWLRSVADNDVVNQVGGRSANFIPEDELRFIAGLDPIRSIYPGDMTEARGRMPEAFNVMAGFFFVCADLGLTYDFIWRSAEAWRNRCDELLADNNWRANHNFRASTIVLLAATESCAPTLTGAQRVKDYMSAHISRTLHSVDRNRIEEDRERSIHYALLEMWSASIVGMWLDKFGLALAPSTTSEIRNYLNFLLPKAKIALSVDPKPGGITFTFLSDTGHAMQEIGPVIKQLWGPVWEACLLLRWTTIPCPQSLRWHNAVYKTYARVPQR